MAKQTKYPDSFTSHPLTRSVESSLAYMWDIQKGGVSSTKYPIAPDGEIPNSAIRKIFFPIAQDVGTYDDSEFKKKENDMYSLPDVSALLDQGVTEEEIMSKILKFTNKESENNENKERTNSETTEENKIPVSTKGSRVRKKDPRPINLRTLPPLSAEHVETEINSEELKTVHFATAATPVEPPPFTYPLEIPDRPLTSQNKPNTPPPQEISKPEPKKKSKPKTLDKKIKKGPSVKRPKASDKTKQEEHTNEPFTQTKTEVDPVPVSKAKQTVTKTEKIQMILTDKKDSPDLNLLRDIMAEKWFVKVGVPLVKEDVAIAITQMMEESNNAGDHFSMCKRILDIKEQLDFNELLEKDVIRILKKQLGKIIETWFDLNQTDTSQANVIKKLLLKARGTHILELLTDLGYDLVDLKKKWAALQEQPKRDVQETPADYTELITDDIQEASPEASPTNEPVPIVATTITIVESKTKSGSSDVHLKLAKQDDNKLLKEIVAETWFTMKDVAIEKRSVLMALTLLMDKTERSNDHGRMCKRVLDIKSQLSLEENLEKELIEVLKKQFMQVLNSCFQLKTTAATRPHSGKRQQLWKNKGKNILNLLGELGHNFYDLEEKWDALQKALDLSSDLKTQLLKEIVAETWFTLENVAIEKRNVTMALTLLMDKTERSNHHKQMCKRVLDIKNQLNLEENLEKDLVEILKDQFMQVINSCFEITTTGAARPHSGKRHQLWKNKGNNILILLGELGYDFNDLHEKWNALQEAIVSSSDLETQLLQEIVAETWFTLEYVAIEKRSVTLALTLLMDKTERSSDHGRMCKRILDIKNQLNLEDNLEKELIEILKDQFMQVINSCLEITTTGAARPHSGKRQKLWKNKGNNILNLLGELGYDFNDLQEKWDALQEAIVLSLRPTPESSSKQNDSDISESNIVDKLMEVKSELERNSPEKKADSSEIQDELLSNSGEKEERQATPTTGISSRANSAANTNLTRQTSNEDKFETQDSRISTSKPIRKAPSMVDSGYGSLQDTRESTMVGHLRDIHELPAHLSMGMSVTVKAISTQSDSGISTDMGSASEEAVDTSNKAAVNALAALTEESKSERPVTTNSSPANDEEMLDEMFGDEDAGNSLPQMSRPYSAVSHPKKSAKSAASTRASSAHSVLQTMPCLSSATVTRFSTQPNRNQFSSDDITLPNITPFANKHKMDKDNIFEQYIPGNDNTIFDTEAHKAKMEKGRNALILALDRSNLNRSFSTVEKKEKKRVTIMTPVQFISRKPFNYSRPRSEPRIYSSGTGRPSYVSSADWSKLSGPAGDTLPSLQQSLAWPDHCKMDQLAKRGLHKPGISISRHLDRYALIETISRGVNQSMKLQAQFHSPQMEPLQNIY